MAQLVTRIDDDLARRIDELVEAGVVTSRSDAVRRGLERLVDEHRRLLVADAIVRGYLEQPQDDREMGWPDTATVRMIESDPW